MKGLTKDQITALSNWIEQALGKSVVEVGIPNEKSEQRIKCSGEDNPGLKVTLNPFEGGTLLKLYSFSDSWLDENPTGEKDVFFRWHDGVDGEAGELVPVHDESKVQIKQQFNQLETKDLAEERVVAREKMGAFQREFKTPENTGGKCAYLTNKRLTLPPNSEAYVLKHAKTPSTSQNPEGSRLYEALIVPYSPSFEDRTPTAIQYRRSGKSKAMSLPGVKQKEAFCILQKGEPIHGTNKHVVLLSESASTGLALANAAKDTTVICCISINEIINTYNIIKDHYKDTAIIVPALDKLKGFKESSVNMDQYKIEKHFADLKVPVLQLNKHEEEYKDMTDFHDFMMKYGLPSLRAYITQHLKRITPEAPEVAADKGKAYELVNFNGVKQSIDKHLHFVRDIKECVSEAYLEMIWKSDPSVKTEKELSEIKEALKAKGTRDEALRARMKSIRQDNDKAKVDCIKNQLNLQLGKQRSGGRAIGIFKGTEQNAFVANAEFGTVVLKNGQIRTSARRRPEGTHFYKDFSEFDAPDIEAAVFNTNTLKELNGIWNSIYGKKDSTTYMPLMGWATQACLAGVGKFRAHASISGVTGAGKSTLAQQFLEPLLCGLFRFFPKATAAGINQVISTKDVYRSHQAICLDEFDTKTQENKKLHDAVSAQKKISATTTSRGSVQGTKDGIAAEREVRQAYMTTSTSHSWADLQQKKRDIQFYLKDNKFASQNLALEALPGRILNVRAGVVKGILLSAEYYLDLWNEVREQLNHYVEQDAQMSHMIAMITCCLAGYGGLKLVARLEELGLTKKDMLENPEEEKKHIQEVAKWVIRANSTFIGEQMNHSNDLAGLREDLALNLSTVNINSMGITRNLYKHLEEEHGHVDNDNYNPQVIGQSGMFAGQDNRGRACIYIIKQDLTKAKNFLERVPDRGTGFALTDDLIYDGINAGAIEEVKAELPDKSRRKCYKVSVSFDVTPEESEEVENG